jgi:hypothetical protein
MTCEVEVLAPSTNDPAVSLNGPNAATLIISARAEVPLADHMVGEPRDE